MFFLCFYSKLFSLDNKWIAESCKSLQDRQSDHSDYDDHFRLCVRSKCSRTSHRSTNDHLNFPANLKPNYNFAFSLAAGVHPGKQLLLVIAGQLLGHVQPAIRHRRFERQPAGQRRNASGRGERREPDRGGTRLRGESCAEAKVRGSENVHRRGERNESAGY